jgi:predicted MFS family arabinose efflux permease
LAVEAGVAALLLMVGPNSAPWEFIPGLLLIGSGIGLIMPASVNLVQSAASEEDQGDISGVSRSASNFGSSLGTAVAGAVLVSALIVGVTQFTQESTVLPPPAKEQIAVALKGDVTALSDTQVEEALQGQPPEIVQEVVRINAAARNRALGFALLAVGVVGLIGFAAIFSCQDRPTRGR